MDELYGDIGQQDQGPETDGPNQQDQTQQAIMPDGPANPPSPQPPTPTSAPPSAPSSAPQAPTAPKEASKWSDVASDKDYLNLPSDQRSIVQNRYYNNVIAADPDFQQLPPDQQKIVQQRFMETANKTTGADVVNNAKNIIGGEEEPTGPISYLMSGIGHMMRQASGDERPAGYPDVQSDTDAAGEKKVPEDKSIPAVVMGMTGSAAGNPLSGAGKGLLNTALHLEGDDGTGVTPVRQGPLSSQDALAMSKALYAKADAEGGVGGGKSVTDTFLDKVKDQIPEEGSLVRNARGEGGADSPTQRLINNLEQNRGQMASYKSLDELDKYLGNEAHQYFVKGDNKTGSEIAKINDALLDTMAEAPAGTLPGVQYGEAARQAFTQQLKLRKLEQMQQFADNTKNPATSMQAQMRQLVKTEGTKKTSPWTKDELDAADKAAKTGKFTDLLQTAGNRLSFLTGHTLTGKAVNYAASAGARAAADKIQFGKASNVAQTVSDKVPSVYDIKGLIPRIQNGETVSDADLANSMGQ